MKLNLSKSWYENRIPKEKDLEVGLGSPFKEESGDAGKEAAQFEPEEFVELYAFGGLVQFLRRDHMLSIEQLASRAQIDPLEILTIERDAKYVPKPRTVHQLAQFFKLPERPLLKLSNVTTDHNEKLRDAAVRFAANSTKVMELSREERAALSEFVDFLSSQSME
jgi:transcriptional regulator with XRE-family HTH domain